MQAHPNLVAGRCCSVEQCRAVSSSVQRVCSIDYGPAVAIHRGRAYSAPLRAGREYLTLYTPHSEWTLLASRTQLLFISPWGVRAESEYVATEIALVAFGMLTLRLHKANVFINLMCAARG